MVSPHPSSILSRSWQSNESYCSPFGLTSASYWVRASKCEGKKKNREKIGKCWSYDPGWMVVLQSMHNLSKSNELQWATVLHCSNIGGHCTTCGCFQKTVTRLQSKHHAGHFSFSSDNAHVQNVSHSRKSTYRKFKHSCLSSHETPQGCMWTQHYYHRWYRQPKNIHCVNLYHSKTASHCWLRIG